MILRRRMRRRRACLRRCTVRRRVSVGADRTDHPSGPLIDLSATTHLAPHSERFRTLHDGIRTEQEQLSEMNAQVVEVVGRQRSRSRPPPEQPLTAPSRGTSRAAHNVLTAQTVIRHL